MSSQCGHFLWPVSKVTLRSPLAYRTGGAFEVYVVGNVLLLATLYYTYTYVAIPMMAA